MPGGKSRVGQKRRVTHGFPRVPSVVNDAHVLRRYLQSLRDALNEFQWLFGFLGGLSSKQQDDLSTALLNLIKQQQLIDQLNQSQNSQNLTLNSLQLLVQQLQQDLQTANNSINQLQTENQNQQAQIDQLMNDMTTVQNDITTIQNNCC